MKRVLLLLLLQLGAILCHSITVETYGNLSLTGRVTDTNGSPLIGATVLLDGYMLGTSTNTSGVFVLNRLNAGSYTLTVTYIGYQTGHVKVSIPENAEIAVVLTPSSVMCDEVVVSSTRASGRMPIAQTAMGKGQIGNGNSATDIPLLLEVLPSIVATTEGGAGIGNSSFRIRGTDMSRINVTVNSIPLNDAESQGVFWVNMPDFSSSVDNVQVQRGVGTSTNGSSAFGATVNFQTATLTPEPFANIDATYGSYNTFKSSVSVGSGLINDRFSFEGRFSKLLSDGYIDRGGSNHQSMFLTGAWHGKSSLVRLNVIHGEEHTDITWEGTPGYMLSTNRRYNPAGEYTDASGNTCYYDDQKDNYKQTHYHLIASHAFNENLRGNITLHATKGDGYYEEYKADKKFSKYGLNPLVIGDTTIKKADFVHRKYMDNIFYGAIASVTYNTGTIDATVGGGWNKYDGDHFGNILWSSANCGIPANYEWYNNNGTKTDWNAFAKAIWQPYDFVSLYADLQFRGISYDLKGIDSDVTSLDQEHSWDFFNPKFGASFSINPANQVYLSFGIANREPSRSDLKDSQKGVIKFTPKSEQLMDFEIGYRFKHQIVAFEANLYYMKYKDQLVLTGELSDVGYSLMTNVPNSYRAGAELIIGIKPLSWLKWEANTTLSQNIINDFVEHVDLYDSPNDWNPLPQEVNNLGNTAISFSPAVVGASVLSVYPIKGITLQWTSKYVGKQYMDNTENDSRMLDAYWVNNFKVDYRFKLNGLKSVFVQGIVNNLLNAKYESNAWVYRAKFQSDGSEYREDGYYPQAEANFAIRLGIEF